MKRIVKFQGNSSLNSVLSLVFLSSLVAVLWARFSLFSFASHDYYVFLSVWFTHLNINGFDFQQNFSNYNFPYLYLLWFSSLFTDNALLAVKVLSFVADLVLAAGVWMIVRIYASEVWACAGFILCLMLPEMFLNSSMWGQADAVFTAFVVWAVYFFLKDKPAWGWVFFFIAFSFKLQAIFILPALVVWFVYKKGKVRHVLVGVAVFFATFIPALVFGGRPLGSLFYAYTSQLGGSTGSSALIANIPNITVLFTIDPLHPNLKIVMVSMAFAVTVLIVGFLLTYQNIMLNQKFVFLKLATTFALILPFILPYMLDRYFFLANILLFLLALLDARYIIPAVVSQTVAVITYVAHLSLTEFNEPLAMAVPLTVLTVVQMVNIGAFLFISYYSVGKKLYDDVKY